MLKASPIHVDKVLSASSAKITGKMQTNPAPSISPYTFRLSFIGFPIAADSTRKTSVCGHVLCAPQIIRMPSASSMPIPAPFGVFPVCALYANRKHTGKQQLTEKQSANDTRNIPIIPGSHVRHAFISGFFNKFLAFFIMLSCCLLYSGIICCILLLPLYLCMFIIMKITHLKRRSSMQKISNKKEEWTFIHSFCEILLYQEISAHIAGAAV
ncbi:MAG: hypothetical protein IKJ51_02905 [Clostridia bacterium]|nr:hypothetical protein [Clostridia bacterium]